MFHVIRLTNIFQTLIINSTKYKFLLFSLIRKNSLQLLFKVFYNDSIRTAISFFELWVILPSSSHFPQNYILVDRLT